MAFLDFEDDLDRNQKKKAIKCKILDETENEIIGDVDGIKCVLSYQGVNKIVRYKDGTAEVTVDAWLAKREKLS